MNSKRLSIRLTSEEWGRIEKWIHVLRERTNGHFTVNQKTVLIEALDALDEKEVQGSDPTNEVTGA